MYYQSYEDYMRSVLGYPIESQNTYETFYNSEIPYTQSQIYSKSVNYSPNILDLYPDIYKIVNPMVCKICETNTKPITRELIEKMTDEIYSNIESQPDYDTTVNIRVNTSTSLEKNNKISNNSSKEKETRQDRQRRPNNPTLRDLIRILILNQLLGGNFPNRPSRPPRPPRPPMRPLYPRNEGIYEDYYKY